MSEITKPVKDVKPVNKPPKKKKNKRFIIILVIILTLGIFGLLVIGHFAFKACHKKEGEFSIKVLQPEESLGWELTVNGKKGEFYVNRYDTLNVVVSPISTKNVNYSCFDNVTNDAVYFAQVSSQQSPQTSIAESPLQQQDDKWVTSFEMQWTFDIIIQVNADQDYDRFVTTKDENNEVIYYYDMMTLCSASSPILRTRAKTFQSEEIERKDFNDNLWIGKKMSYISSSFLSQCTSFNSPINFLQKEGDEWKDEGVVNKIGSQFLHSCSSFNQPIIFPASLLQIDGSFMYQCTSFNQPIDTKNIQYLCDGGDNATFLFSCTSFNSTVTFGSALKNVPSNFLVSCRAFNQPITIPSTIENVRGNFLRNCDAMTNVITVECPSSAFASSENICSTDNPLAPCFLQQMKIAGTNADKWIETYPYLFDTKQGIYRSLKKA